MNVETPAKLLFSSLKEIQFQGFTRTGLLVRILLYSCLATSLALTAYDFRCNQWFSCANKVMQAEAKQQIEAANRAHQVYFFQNGTFTNSWENLGLFTPRETNNYIYQISLPNGPVQTSNNQKNLVPYFESVITIAQPKKNSTVYMGAIFAFKRPDSYESTLIASICEFDKPILFPTMPTLVDGEIHCPVGARLSNR
jgi:hypothetical protein